MPDLDGRQVADRALKLRPDLKIVFMSGYTGEAIARDGILEPGIELITKPFTQAQLAARVRLALNGGANL